MHDNAQHEEIQFRIDYWIQIVSKKCFVPPIIFGIGVNNDSAELEGTFPLASIAYICFQANAVLLRRFRFRDRTRAWRKYGNSYLTDTRLIRKINIESEALSRLLQVASTGLADGKLLFLPRKTPDRQWTRSSTHYRTVRKLKVDLKSRQMLRLIWQ